jgi:3'(2'), 5'-bisphosphate nucleotidase
LAIVSPFAAELAQIAHEAGRLILKHYAAPVQVRAKADESPVTAADEEAEALIESRLAVVSPGVPVIAEEAVASGRVPGLARVLLVDPLDGTKEFLKKNGEFTVNIALYRGPASLRRRSRPPRDAPSSARARAQPSKWRRRTMRPLDLPASAPFAHVELRRTGSSPWSAAPIAMRRARNICPRTKSPTSMPRFVAEIRSDRAGEADLYPRHGPTSEWDTAAGQAVLEAAGARS